MEKRFHFLLGGVSQTGNCWACGKSLSEGLQKLDTYQVDLAGLLLPFDSGLNGRHAGGNQTGGDDRGGRDRQGDDIVDSQGARTDDECS